MITIARAYQYLHEDIKLDFEQRVQTIVKERFGTMHHDWSLPLEYAPSPLVKTDIVKDTPEKSMSPSDKAELA